jgi:hypothetical protein
VEDILLAASTMTMEQRLTVIANVDGEARILVSIAFAM